MEFSENDGAVSFNVRVVPRASRSEIVGHHDGALKIRISAPPVDGAANDELIRALAKFFGVAKSSVEITGGASSKAKRVRIAATLASIKYNLERLPNEKTA